MWKWKRSSSEGSSNSRSASNFEPTPRQIKIAEQMKQEGNELFKRGKFLAASEKYTEALALRPQWTTALVNRATAFKKLHKWYFVERDCKAAIAVDRKCMKAHYFLGLALEARNDLDTSLKHLETAYDLAMNKDDEIISEIWKTIARVNYTRWETSMKNRLDQDTKLMSRLHYLLSQTHAEEIKKSPNDVRLVAAHNQEMAALEDIFSRARVCDAPQEIPSHLTCVLTMDIFRDPVVTPSGYSYEKSVLMSHIDRGGNFDPINRQPLSKSELVPNINLRNASHQYLKDHPWAWKECM